MFWPVPTNSITDGKDAFRLKQKVYLMDLSEMIAHVKALPGFAEHVGMILAHNGVVRAWSRADHSPVARIKVSVNRAAMDALVKTYEQRPGIFKIMADAREGELKAGDDMLFLVVAGDIRENVKATLGELLDRVKSETMIKQEFAE